MELTLNEKKLLAVLKPLKDTVKTGEETLKPLQKTIEDAETAGIISLASLKNAVKSADNAASGAISRALELIEEKKTETVRQLEEPDASFLAAIMGTNEAAVVQYANLCQDKGLANVERRVETTFHLTKEGEKYAGEGLPERNLIESFDSTISMKELNQHPQARIGIGWLRKKGWVTIKAGIVEKTGDAPAGEDEIALKDLSVGGEGVKELIKRKLVEEHEAVSHIITITPAGAALVEAGLDFRTETGRITREQIISGEWKDLKLRKYSVDRLPKRAFCGKIHPYQQLIDEMRHVLLEMGFTEIYGDVIQSSFWNFDALFQPQDHPAREMQDTFFLDQEAEVPEGYEAVRDIHEFGGNTSSTGWGGKWDLKKAEQCVLRTHTTGLSIQYLKENPEPPVKAFCIGRVYRREAIDPTHTPEFEQLEGIVMDKNVSFRHLMGFLKEFYARMGFEDVRFRPAYFPYTEPSVEPEVFVDGLGWVELGGAGIFREEVADPWGVKYPVLAWGLGVSRVAMLKMGLKDLRQLYRSDIDWVRSNPVYQKGRE